MTGTAFTGSLEGTVPTKASIFYHRDAELLDINKRKKSGRKVRVDDDDEDDDELELCSHFSDEEFNEGTYLPHLLNKQCMYVQKPIFSSKDTKLSPCHMSLV